MRFYIIGHRQYVLQVTVQSFTDKIKFNVTLGFILRCLHFFSINIIKIQPSVPARTFI